RPLGVIDGFLRPLPMKSPIFPALLAALLVVLPLSAQDPAKPLTASEKAAKAEEPKRPDNSGEGAPHAPSAEPATATRHRPQTVAAPAKGERIALVGNGLAERDVYYSRIETELHLRYPESELFLRNLGRPG